MGDPDVDEDIRAKRGLERTVTVELLGGGQRRPYGDSIWEAYLTFSVPEGQAWASKLGHGNADMVKPYIPLFIHPFEEEPQWWQTRLDKLEEVSPGHWFVRIVQPYLD